MWWKWPSGKKRKDEHGRNDTNSERFLEELPGNWMVIGPANMRNEKVSELDGWHGNSGGGEGGGKLHSPYEGIGALLLRDLGQLQHTVPEPLLRRLLCHVITNWESEQQEIRAWEEEMLRRYLHWGTPNLNWNDTGWIGTMFLFKCGHSC